MDIVAVKANSNCFKKVVTGLNADTEALVRKTLRIKGIPFSCSHTDIQDGKLLKKSMMRLDAEAEVQENNSMKALRQYICALDDRDYVVLLDADKYSNFDIFCWNKALEAHMKGHNPIVAYRFYHHDLPAKYFPRHNIFFFADLGYDQYYGEVDKSKRVCRFCGTSDQKKFGIPKNSHH